jgi:hypothetical protein
MSGPLRKLLPFSALARFPSGYRSDCPPFGGSAPCLLRLYLYSARFDSAFRGNLQLSRGHVLCRRPKLCSGILHAGSTYNDWQGLQLALRCWRVLLHFSPDPSLRRNSGYAQDDAVRREESGAKGNEAARRIPRFAGKSAVLRDDARTEIKSEARQLGAARGRFAALLPIMKRFNHLGEVTRCPSS